MADHYVYLLIDPRDSQPFYVGKGKGRRAWQHERDVRKGVVSNTAKTARIAEILAVSLSPVVYVAASFADERDALDEEARLIGQLANLTNIQERGFPRGIEQFPSLADARRAIRAGVDALASLVIPKEGGSDGLWEHISQIGLILDSAQRSIDGRTFTESVT